MSIVFTKMKDKSATTEHEGYVFNVNINPDVEMFLCVVRTGTITNWYSRVLSMAAATRGAAIGRSCLSTRPSHKPITAGNIMCWNTR
jgi:hypothetical protein